MGINVNLPLRSPRGGKPGKKKKIVYGLQMMDPWCVTLTTGCSQFIFGCDVALATFDILQLTQIRFFIRLFSVILETFEMITIFLDLLG